jgi:phosphomannomutase/phosphoglucomutase
MKPGIIDLYKEAVKSHVDINVIRKEGFRVVADPGNGAGALAYPNLLSEVGCDVTTINSEVDGAFPGRPPEPRPEELTELSERVLDLGADLGIAYDGDGDRALFCDEKGVIHWGDKSAAILLEQVLKGKENRRVVTPISSSKLIEDVAKRCKAELIYTKVGSIDVSYKMKETGSLYGCEENGGCFYAPHQPVRDGGMTSLLMLEALATTGKTLSQLVAELPTYYLVKKRVECRNRLKSKVLDRLIKLTEGYERILIDGVKVILPKGRVLMRPSGTEPIFRVYAEAASEEGAEEVAQWGMERVKQAIKEST